MNSQRDEVPTEAKIISGRRTVPQKTILDRARRAASGFKQLGLSEGDSVALILRNDIVFLESSFGAELIGAYAVPVNWHFTAEEAGYIVRNCRAKAVIVHADLLPHVAPGLPEGLPILCAPTPDEIVDAYGLDPAAAEPPADVVNWDRWIEDIAPIAEDVSARPRVAVFYTSGTTGQPKGVQREPMTPEMFEKFKDTAKTLFGFGPGESFRTVVTGPMYHAAPNFYGITAARNSGLVILQPKFDCEELLQLVERYRITHLHMVPIMFVRLLKMKETLEGKYDLSSLKFVTHAAAPCPPEVKREMIEWWGPIINEYYGTTETGGVVFHTSKEALDKPGTVGRPIEGGIVKILDENGDEVPVGVVGNVYLKLENYPDFAYVGQPRERKEIEKHGLVTPGDVGYVDHDGYLFLCDRSKDMIISGGVNIYPAEIEATIVGHPEVLDCAVFGIPDEEYGESVAAYIQPEDGAEISENDIIIYLQDRLAKYKNPKLIKIVRDLPREESGKIFKRKLREPYWENTGRSI